MARYSELPAEVRQWILCLSIPDFSDVTQPWLHEVRHLMLINKQSFDDVRKVLQLLDWSVVYTIRKNVPPTLPTEQFRGQFSILPPPTTVCLCLFYDIDIGKMRAGPEVDSVDYYPQIRQWVDALSVLLTRETKRILIDATPAPWHIRRNPLAHTASLVNDKRTKKWFLVPHHDAIRSLFKRISDICGNETDLFLVGTYGERCRNWVDSIIEACSHTGVQVHSGVKYAHHSPSRRSLLWQATRNMRPILNKLKADWLWAWNAEVRMRSTSWRGSTCKLYEECLADNKEWALYVLSQVTYFIAAQPLSTLDLTPSPKRERKLAHYMIEDIGFWSESVNEEPNRFVRFSSDRMPRPWERNTENVSHE